MKVSATTGALLASSLENLVDGGNLLGAYEEAIRDVIIGEPVGTFGIVDVSDLSWIEIDFPDDLERAKQTILPNLR